jgi:hypothetical protein
MDRWRRTLSPNWPTANRVYITFTAGGGNHVGLEAASSAIRSRSVVFAELPGGVAEQPQEFYILSYDTWGL